MNAIEQIREMLYDEIECIANENKLTSSTLDVIDKLTHSLKSIDTIMAMEEYDNDYSQRGSRYNDGYSYSVGSRAGRTTRNVMRGNSRDNSGYRMNKSGQDGKEKMKEKLEDYLDETNSDKIRETVKKLIEQLDSEE